MMSRWLLASYGQLRRERQHQVFLHIGDAQLLNVIKSLLVTIAGLFAFMLMRDLYTEIPQPTVSRHPQGKHEGQSVMPFLPPPLPAPNSHTSLTLFTLKISQASPEPAVIQTQKEVTPPLQVAHATVRSPAWKLDIRRPQVSAARLQTMLSQALNDIASADDAHAKQVLNDLLLMDPWHVDALATMIALMQRTGDLAGLQNYQARLAYLLPEDRQQVTAYAQSTGDVDE